MSTTTTSSDYRRVPDHLQKPHDTHYEWLMRRLWERLNRRNEHFVGCIVGQEGIGKSYTAMKIASEVDPSFTHERVFFDVIDFIEELNEGDYRQGDVYVLDEAGVSMGKRTWQDRSQILVNQALQLIRSHNLGFIFSLPRLSELDSQAEGRLQWFYEIKEKEIDEYVRGAWLFRDPDRRNRTGEIYDKFPRRFHDGEKIRITSFAFTPPDDELIEPYERRKSEFQDEFYREVIEEYRDEEEDSEEAPAPKQVAAQIVDDGVESVLSEHGNTGEPYINKDLIRAEYGLSHRDAKSVKALLDKQIEVENYA